MAGTPTTKENDYGFEADYAEYDNSLYAATTSKPSLKKKPAVENTTSTSRPPY